MIYIADTHSLLWFLSEDVQLSAKAKQAFDICEEGRGVIVIPTIVLAELLYLCEKKGKEEQFFKVIEKIEEGTNYMTYNLDMKVIAECRNLKKIKEMHDKIIVATARILKATIITRDNNIKDSRYADIIW